MKDGAVVTIDHKQSLHDMLLTKNLLLEDIYENNGEIDNQQSDSLVELDTSIPVKVDGWAWTLKKEGAIDKEIELWQDRKEVVEQIIKSLRNGRDRLKTRAHHIMLMNHFDRIDGNQFWIKREISKSRTVILDKVEDEYKKYELPTLDYVHYTALVEAVDSYAIACSKDDSKELFRTISELQYYIREQIEIKCNVTDLPNEHVAIVTEEKPTVRIYPKR